MIGERIKSIRKDRGLTQKQLGEKCDPKIHEVQIRKYERGEVVPKMPNVIKIAEALGVSTADLIGPEWFDLQLGPEKVRNLSKEVSGLQALEQYLQSLGYSLAYEGPSETGDPDVALTKGKERTVFTGDQFKQFEKAISDSVEYQIWQQRNK